MFAASTPPAQPGQPAAQPPGRAAATPATGFAPLLADAQRLQPATQAADDVAPTTPASTAAALPALAGMLLAAAAPASLQAATTPAATPPISTSRPSTPAQKSVGAAAGRQKARLPARGVQPPVSDAASVKAGSPPLAVGDLPPATPVTLPPVPSRSEAAPEATSTCRDAGPSRAALPSGSPSAAAVAPDAIPTAPHVAAFAVATVANDALAAASHAVGPTSSAIASTALSIAAPVAALAAGQGAGNINATTAARPAHAGTLPTAASPAAQVQPALLAVVGRGAGQAITVALNPAELGQVQVRVQHAADGGLQVALTVERPETLHLLEREQAQLGRALDQAGVPPEARTITFQVAPATGLSGQSGATSGGAGDSPPHGHPGMQGGDSTTGQGGTRSGDQRAALGQEPGATDDATSGADDGPAAWGDPSGTTIQGAGRWDRYGIDITA